MAGLKVYTMEGKTKVYGIEGVYYKLNHSIIERENGKLILRNTYTGEEQEISLSKAKELLKSFQYK